MDKLEFEERPRNCYYVKSNGSRVGDIVLTGEWCFYPETFPSYINRFNAAELSQITNFIKELEGEA